MPTTMAPSDSIKVRLNDAIRAAADAYCETHGVELSDLIRTGLCKEIGKPELASTMLGRGRPKKAPAKKKPKK